MNIEDRTKFIQIFLEKMDEKSLFDKVNSKLLNDEYVRNFPLTLADSGDTLHSIVDHYEDGKITFSASHEEVGIFVLFFEINYVNSSLEYIKKMLMMLLPKSIISTKNFWTYGQLLSMISDKLGESENYKKTVIDAFLVNLRNAISHVDYFIEKYQIIIKINGKKENENQIQNIVDICCHIYNIIFVS